MIDKICNYYKNSTDSWINLHNANRVEGFRFLPNITDHDKILKQILEFKKGENILDAGCGVGEPGITFAREFSETNFFLVNISDYQLNKITDYPDNVFLIHSDFHKLNFKDSFFDKIYFLESFSHSIFKRKLLKEMYRVLKPGGILLNLDFCRKKNISKKQLNIHRNTYFHFPVYSSLLRSLFNSENFKEIFFYETLKNNITINKDYNKDSFYCFNEKGITDFGKIHLPIHENNAHVQEPCLMLYKK